MLGSDFGEIVTAAQALKAAGYTVKDLQEYLLQYNTTISVSSLSKHLKASSVQYGRREVWEGINSFMAEHDIPWSDEW